MDDLEGILGQHPLLQDLAPRHLRELAGCASNVRFNAGQMIFHEEDEATGCYFIRSGRVAIEIYAGPPGPVTIETVSEGGILGWSWLVPPYRTHFDARAVELTRAIAIDTTCLRAKMTQDHDLGYELLNRFAQVIVQRLTAASIQLLDIYRVRERG